VRSAFRWGRECGVALSGLLWMTGGRGWIDPLAPSRGYAEMQPLPPASRSREVQTGAVEVSPTAFPRATALSFSGTRHEEDQPSHLLIADPDVCVTRCAQEYSNPCQRFCPAGVYEIVGSAPPSLVLHAANCLHCKTCEIMDPYQVVTWVPPEGGGGPRYEGL
jgi:electron-transferring-flavoprotein dehydrogenase